MLTCAKHIVTCLVFYDVQSRTYLIGHNKTSWISGDDLMVVGPDPVQRGVACVTNGNEVIVLCGHTRLVSWFESTQLSADLISLSLSLHKYTPGIRTALKCEQFSSQVYKSVNKAIIY